jgi:Hemerythrin HHE cation binding domain
MEALNAHHTTEERILFPILARALPQFAHGAEHLDSHKAIHDGIGIQYISITP